MALLALALEHLVIVPVGRWPLEVAGRAEVFAVAAVGWDGGVEVYQK